MSMVSLALPGPGLSRTSKGTAQDGLQAFRTVTDLHARTGWEAGKSVYNTKRYTPSTIVVI